MGNETVGSARGEAYRAMVQAYSILAKEHSLTCLLLGQTQAVLLAMHETLESITEAVDCGSLTPMRDGKPAPDRDPGWDVIDQARHLVREFQEMADSIANAMRGQTAPSANAERIVAGP